MGYSEIYSTLLNGVATRLRNGLLDSGPFAQSDQVKLWVDEALDEVAPSRELEAELSRAVPIALVCDGALHTDDVHSDGCDLQQEFAVWFASGAPTMAAAVTGDGDEYWGACALKDWIIKRLLDRSWSISGWDGPRLVEVRPVALRGTCRGLYRATFRSQRLQSG